MFPAISSNHTLLVIKNNNIIGKANVATSRGSEVSVRFTDGEICNLVNDRGLTSSFGLRYSYFRFFANTGCYCGSVDDTVSGEDDILSDVSVVDEFNFRWGMVPDHFSMVPGYRAAETEM